MPRRSLLVIRGLTFATGLIECFCFAGAVFGWASLVYVLKSEGYFSSLCVNATDVNGTNILDCSRQDEQFSLVFTIASFLNNFLTMPNGFIFDHFGTRVTRLLAICLYTTGTLMLGFSTSGISNILFPGLPLVAIGGMVLLITNIQVGNLFGSHRSTVITLYNGAFDSSSALFLVIKLLHEVGISLKASFLFISACGVALITRTLVLMPRSFIPHPLPDDFNYGIHCVGQEKKEEMMRSDSTVTTEDETPKDERENRGMSFREALLSRLFIFHLLWLSLMQLRHYFFIGTLNSTLQRLTEGEPSLVSKYINAFAGTQLCGVFCAPWNGLIMDRHRNKPRANGESEQEADLRSSVLSLFLTSLQCMFFSVFATIPYLPLQYGTFILQVINRSFLYGGNAAFVSIAFPAHHFGKIYGLIMGLSAIISLLQYPLFAVVRNVLNGDPLYVNIFLTLLTLLTFAHPLSVYLYCRNKASQREEGQSSRF